MKKKTEQGEQPLRRLAQEREVRRAKLSDRLTEAAARRATLGPSEEVAALAQKLVSTLRPVAGLDDLMLSLDVAGLLHQGTDDELKNWTVARYPAAPRTAEEIVKQSVHERHVGPSPRDHLLVAPGERMPDGATKIGTLADLRAAAALREQRLGAILSKPRTASILVSKE